MTVEARALVAGRDVREAMRRLEGELLEDLHRHRPRRIGGAYLQVTLVRIPTLSPEQAARLGDAAAVVAGRQVEDEAVRADGGEIGASR